MTALVATSATSFRPEVFSLDPLRLLGMQCGECDQISFPARESCPACGSPEPLTERPLSTTGVLSSWTVVRNAPDGLVTPYTLAYVDLPSDGVRVMSRLGGVDAAELRVGLPLELAAESLRSQRTDADETDERHMFVFHPRTQENR